MLEKHYTLDRAQDGFDHANSLDPAEFERYVGDVRDAEAALDPEIPKVGDAEATTAQRARRSIYAASDLEAGTELTREHLVVVRPPGPLGAGEVDALIGRPLTRPLRQYEPLSHEVLG